MKIYKITCLPNEAHGRSIDAVLAEIRREQNIEKNESINPDIVGDGLLEHLGEAVMRYMVPNPRQHEWMDEMMGGEGSENLAAMYWLMGSMMMGVTMGSGTSGWDSMMGYGMMGYGHDALAVLNERYVRGEIDGDEHQRIKQELVR
jgi:uncharacterized membrane protein